MKGRADSPSFFDELVEDRDRIRTVEFALSRGDWRFNFDNEGGWGYLQFNDCFDLDELPDPLAVGGSWGAAIEDDSGCGLLIGSTAGMLLKTRESDLQLLADDGSLYAVGSTRAWLISSGQIVSSQPSGIGLNCSDATAHVDVSTVNGAVTINSGGDASMTAGAAKTLTLAVAATSEVIDATKVQFTLPTSGKFAILDHLGNPILRVDETGGYHIKTGATWVADL